MHFRSRHIGSVTATVFLGIASPALAATSASVSLSGGAEQSVFLPATGTFEQTFDGTGGTLRLDQFDADNTSVAASLLDVRSVGLATVTASGSSTASIAGLRMSALVSGGAGAKSPDGAFIGATVNVAGSVSDEFVLLAPSLPLGALLDLTGSVYTDATTVKNGSVTGGGSFETAVSWQSTFQLSRLGSNDITTVLLDESCRFGTTVEFICSGGPGISELKLLVPNGATLRLNILGRASAYGTAGGGGFPGDGSATVDAGADLGSTIAWAGITSLKDANGNAITSFSALNNTGSFDYRQGFISAVPLPPTIALLATAVAGLGGAAARRRKQRPAGNEGWH